MGGNNPRGVNKESIPSEKAGPPGSDQAANNPLKNQVGQLLSGAGGNQDFLAGQHLPNENEVNGIYGKVVFSGGQEQGQQRTAFQAKGKESQILGQPSDSIGGGQLKSPERQRTSVQNQHFDSGQSNRLSGNNVEGVTVQQMGRNGSSSSSDKGNMGNRQTQSGSTDSAVNNRPGNSQVSARPELKGPVSKPTSSNQGMERSSGKPAVNAETPRAGGDAKSSPSKTVEGGRETVPATTAQTRNETVTSTKAESRKDAPPPATATESKKDSHTPATATESKKDSHTPATATESKKDSHTPSTATESKKDSHTPSTAIESKKDTPPPATATESKKDTPPPSTVTESKKDTPSPANTTESRKDAPPGHTTAEGRKDTSATAGDKEQKSEQTEPRNANKTAEKQAKVEEGDQTLGQSKSLAHNNEEDDDRQTLAELHAENTLKSLHAEGVVARPADVGPQNFSNLGQAQHLDLNRSATTNHTETNVAHSFQHSVNFSAERSHGATRDSHTQEIKDQDSRSHTSDPSSANSNSSHTGQSHTGSTHQTGAGHSASGHGHSHSGHNSGHGSGHGHQQHGPGHNSNGHTNSTNGNAKDPNGEKDPTGQGLDPNGQGNNRAGSGHDPNGQANNPAGSGHDPNGQANNPAGSGHDPNGQGNNPAGSGHEPIGQGNNQPGKDCGPGNGIDPVTGQPVVVYPGNGFGNFPSEGQQFPVHGENPIRNLVTLISEMGNASAALHNIWSPWGETPLEDGRFNPSHVQSANYDISPSNSGIVNASYPQADQINISGNNNSIYLIDQSQASSNNHLTGNFGLDNTGQAVFNESYNNSYNDQLPAIQTTTQGSPITTHNTITPADNLPSNSGHGVNAGTSSGAQESGANTGTSASNPADFNASTSAGNGQLGGQAAQDANNPFNQFLNGTVDYWTGNLDPGSNSNLNAPHSSLPANDPVPADNSINPGQINDNLPNHDQLVSGAEHYHQLKSHTDNNTDHDQNKSQAEVTDHWLTNEEHKHEGQSAQDQKDQQLAEELRRRLELIVNGTWQDPNDTRSGIRKPEGKDSPNNNNTRKASVSNDGLMGQIMTLLHDLSKGKKPKNASRNYIVKDGDTLESIAAKVLFDVKLALLLYLINQPNLAQQMGAEWKQTKLLRGVVLDLPGEEEINTFRLAMPRGVGQGRADGIKENSSYQEQLDEQYLHSRDERRQNVERLLGPLASASTKFNPETGRQLIRVRLGDTLRSIALKNPVLNDVSLWKLLAKCNNLSTEVDSKGAPVAILTRGMIIQLPGEEEIAAYRASQSAIVRAHSPRKAIEAEVLIMAAHRS